MLAIIIGLAAGLSILFLIENAHSRGLVRTEVARKVIHLISGLILVAWSFYISWEAIVFIELAFMASLGVTRWLKLFDSQHGINRLTWGEFFYPIGVILSIYLGAPRWVFILAILHLCVADAAAAVVGTQYGKGNSYKVFGQTKSLAGSIAFFFVSVLLIVGAFVLAPGEITYTSRLMLFVMPLATTLAENLGAFGTDNLLIPLTVVLLLG
jgi:dolichol kinase